MWNVRSLTAGAALVALVSCASVEKADVPYADAEAAVAEAREAGAAEHAAAALTLAEERLKQAEAAIENNEEERSRALIEEAVVSAELAEAEARSQKSQLAAQAVQQNLRALQSEIVR